MTEQGWRIEWRDGEPLALGEAKATPSRLSDDDSTVEQCWALSDVEMKAILRLAYQDGRASLAAERERARAERCGPARGVACAYAYEHCACWRWEVRECCYCGAGSASAAPPASEPAPVPAPREEGSGRRAKAIAAIRAKALADGYDGPSGVPTEEAIREEMGRSPAAEDAGGEEGRRR